MSATSTELFSIHPDIKVTADGDVTTVTIDRPDTKNVCTGDMWVAIGETFRRLAYSGNVPSSSRAAAPTSAPAPT